MPTKGASPKVWDAIAKLIAVMREEFADDIAYEISARGFTIARKGMQQADVIPTGSGLEPTVAAMLPHDWTATEQGNTLLDNTEGDLAAWINLPGGNKRLQVLFATDNHPALRLAVVDRDDAALAKLIADDYDGWHARKCNIDGVSVVRGIVDCEDGTSGQDRDSYSDDQDRENYTT